MGWGVGARDLLWLELGLAGPQHSDFLASPGADKARLGSEVAV